MALNPAKTVSNPRIAKLIELEVSGRIKPEHQQELNIYRAQGLAPKDTGASLTEAQSKSTGFYNRAFGANRDFEAAPVDAQAAPGLLGDAARAVLPDGIVNSFQSPDRQLTKQAKEDFIRASLRYESGAAIGPSEFVGQDKIFFPQTGDSAEVIAQKAEARRRVIDSLKVSGGDGPDALAKANPAGPSDIGFAGQGADTGASIKQLTEPQRAEYLRIAQTGTPAQLVSYLKGIGYDIANADEVVKDREQGRGVNTNTTVRRPEIAAKNSDGALGSFARGAADTLTAGFLDEAGGLVDTVGDAFGGRLQPGGFRDQLNRNIDRNRSVIAGDEANHGWSRLAGQVVGGLPLPVIGGDATIANLARTGAIYGGAYGAGSADGGLGDRGLNALISAGIGAGAGAGLGALSSRIGRGGGGGATPTPGQEVYEAAARQGIDPLPADVGGPLTRRFTAGAAQSPISGGTIIRGGERVVNQSRTARDRIASEVGNAVDPVAAGETAQAGAQGYVQSSRQRVGRMYDAARDAAGGARPVAQRAIDTLDANLAELAETPATSGPVTSALERLGTDLTDPNGLSVDALRRLRTNVRGMAQTDELRGTDFQRRAGQVLDSISQDIEAGLPESARAQFRAADAAHRERIETIDQVIKPIIGGRGDKAYAPERVFQNIQNATRSDSGRLRRFLDALPEDDRSSVTATVIGQLGRANSGAQNAAGDAFSLGTFLSQWDKMTPRAKATMFQGRSRAALDDLARVAQGSREAAGYANRSNTGGSNVVNTLFGAGAVASYFQPAILAAFATNYGAGRLLASPRFAQWLARPVNTPQQVSQAVRRLSTIATREPAIANDIAQIQQRLQQAMGSGAAAAQEPGNER